MKLETFYESRIVKSDAKGRIIIPAFTKNFRKQPLIGFREQRKIKLMLKTDFEKIIQKSSEKMKLVLVKNIVVNGKPDSVGRVILKEKTPDEFTNKTFEATGIENILILEKVSNLQKK